MKILILNGSPRKGGDTAMLIGALKAELGGEIRQVDAFEAGIRPCVDCRYCRAHPGCCIEDGMQELEQMIGESDAIVIAAPIWFGTLPGPLLSMLSRLQSRFSARFFRKEPPAGKAKKGAVLLTGGGSGGVEGAYATACILLREMGAAEIAPAVTSLSTDRLPAGEDADALRAVRELAKYLQNI